VVHPGQAGAVAGRPAQLLDRPQFEAAREALAAAITAHRGRLPNTFTTPLHGLSATLAALGILDKPDRKRVPDRGQPGHWKTLEQQCPVMTATMRRYLAQMSISMRPGSIALIDTTLRHLASYLTGHHPDVTTVTAIRRTHIEGFNTWMTSRPGYRGSSGPAKTTGLHYGQVIFEGLKAHRRTDGSMALFRPHEHARRFQRSARRLAMPELSEPIFLEAVERVVASDQEWLSDDPGLSLYVRPLMFADEASLALRISRTYTFLTMAFVTGSFFGDDIDAVTVWINRDHPRAMPGGTGDVKCAANYGPSFTAQGEAEHHGCQQVVWLDAVEHRWVEELGGMNLFFVRGSGESTELVTPELTGTLLPGVTRKSLLTLAGRLGYQPREERISVSQWRDECRTGQITEVFACGTAAVVTPVGEVRGDDGGWTVGDGKRGPVTAALRAALVGIHRGLAPDLDGWMHPVG